MSTTRTTGPTGPRTELGKLRSSANAVTTGCQAKYLLLPGEVQSDYEQHQQGILDSLAPGNPAQAQAAMAYGDLSWRLGRWLKVEHQTTLDELDRTIADSSLAKSLGAARNSIQALDAIVRSVEERTEIPAAEAMTIFVSGARAVLEILDMVVGRPEHETQALKNAIDKAEKLHELADKATAFKAFKRMAETARAAQRAFKKLVGRQEEEIKSLRLLLARSVMPSAADVRRLGKYLNLLQRAAMQQLMLLDALREQSKKARCKGTHSKSSFGVGVPTVILRVVK